MILLELKNNVSDRQMVLSDTGPLTLLEIYMVSKNKNNVRQKYIERNCLISVVLFVFLQMITVTEMMNWV